MVAMPWERYGDLRKITAMPKMKTLALSCYALCSYVAAALLAGCGGGSTSVLATQQVSSRHSNSSSSPIQHVVIVVQENRTFNDFFATYPGGDGTTVGKVEANPSCSPPIKAGTIPLAKVPLNIPKDLNHSYKGYEISRDGGKMDGFDLVTSGTGPECTYPYQYTDPAQIVPYWDMAEQYALAEHMFTTQGSDSFVAHQDLIRGGTEVEHNKGMIDFPTCGGGCWWGCNAAPYTTTHLVSKDNVALGKPGPFPCTKDFKLPYQTLRDLMDKKGVTWKYYQPLFSKDYGHILSAFDVIWPVRNGSEWKTNIVTPQTAIFGDISSGNLPNVSWVIPDQDESDHPHTPSDTGPSWVASIVNAIGQSSYWDSTAIIIVWDDWGGLYDNKPPKVMDYGGLGFRVPAIIVSPYARAGSISQTNYEFGSILRYVEDNWNLGYLGKSDSRAKSIIDCFNYSQPPITFQQIPSQFSKEYFIHAKYSGPPDTDM
jgi:phospholipase C